MPSHAHPADGIVPVLVPFATLFSSPTWRKAQVLLIGEILTPGQRTVAAALRVIGRSDHQDYARYHEVTSGGMVAPSPAETSVRDAPACTMGSRLYGELTPRHGNGKKLGNSVRCGRSGIWLEN